jgi:hypothetical protein
MGELVETFPDKREFLGRKPSGGRSEAHRADSRQVGNQADGETGGVFQKSMLGAGGDEEYGPRSHRMTPIPDALFPAPAEVKQKLSVGMTVGRAKVEGLEMPVDPEFLHGPVAATQEELPEKDRPDECVGSLSGSAARGLMGMRL